MNNYNKNKASISSSGWESLSLKEKIAQMIMVRINGTFYNEGNWYRKEIEKWIGEDGVGGVIVFGGRVHGTYHNIKQFQEWARHPLLVASDLERGVGQWNSEGTLFPTNMAFAATQDTDKAYKQGQITAQEARALGIHITFSPVLDINNNPDNPIINFRAYSDSPEMVSKFGLSFIKGVQDGGLLACPKHFPGHGNTSIDSHTSLPMIEGSKKELEELEMSPFIDAINAGVEMVMVGHISMPGLDDSGVPATHSKKIVTDLLKKEYGFNGLVVTDGMEMGSITNATWAGEAAVRAVEAGADIILLPIDVGHAIESIYKAVQDGRISEYRIDSSVKKIWDAKKKVNLFENRVMDWEDVEKNVGLKKNKRISQLFANRSITLVKDKNSLIPMTPNRYKKISQIVISSDDNANEILGTFSSDLKRTHGNIDKIVVNKKLSQSRIDGIISEVQGSDMVVVSMLVRISMDRGVSTIDSTHAELLTQLKKNDIKYVAISFGSPYLPSYDDIDTYMCAYGYGSISLKAAANALWGRSSIKGKLPVNLSKDHKRGDGISRKAISYGFLGVDDSYDLSSAWDVIENAIDSEIFPGAQIFISKKSDVISKKYFGKQTYDTDSEKIDESSIYDVASLTKVLSLTPVVMKMVSRHMIGLNNTLDQFYPELRGTQKGKITIQQILSHTAGFKPFIEFYKVSPNLNREMIVKEIFDTELIFTPGSNVKYSDLGIIVLTDIVSIVTRRRLDDLAISWIYTPLGMGSTFYNPGEELLSRVVPTENDSYFRNKLLKGIVHDENAFLMDGISGHAGLFSTASDIGRYSKMILDDGIWCGTRYLKSSVIEHFTTKHDKEINSDRTIGWDTPSINGRSSAGDYFSDGSFGHLGFTGTSVWIDPNQEIIVVLLTNRVYPSRDNPGMYKVRRKFHTEVMKAIM